MKALIVYFVFWTGVPALTEEDLTKLSPTAAVVAKIVKPGMKLMEVRFLPIMLPLAQARM